jgi:hypothetical protein
VETQRAYTQALLQRADVQSVLVVQRHDKPTSFLAEKCYLVMVNRPDADMTIRQFVYDGEFISEQQFSTWQLEKWAVHGMNERLVGLFQQAEIIWDKADYMKGMKQRLLRLPAPLQKQRVCEEYSGLLRRYLEAKDLLQQGLALDAYQSLMLALRAWARLIVSEAGEQPQTAIWLQVKQLDSAVYKLYEELSASSETVEKRIELLLLAIDFCLTSKLRECSQYVLDVMQTRNRPWLLQELLDHPVLARSRIELPLLLEKLVQRSIVQEVFLPSITEHVNEKAYLLSG